MPSSSLFTHAWHTLLGREIWNPANICDHRGGTGHCYWTCWRWQHPSAPTPYCPRRVLFLQDPTLQSKCELRVFLGTSKATFKVCWLNINFLLKINRIKWSLQSLWAPRQLFCWHTHCPEEQDVRDGLQSSCRIHVNCGGDRGLFPTPPEGLWVPSVLRHSVLLPRNWRGRWNPGEILVKALVLSHLISSLLWTPPPILTHVPLSHFPERISFPNNFPGIPNRNPGNIQFM